MIKATIQDNPYCMEIRFPCSETELPKKLGKIGMNTEHLAPIGTVIEIEPTEETVFATYPTAHPSLRTASTVQNTP